MNNEVETKKGSGRAPAAEAELWQKLETFPLNRRDAVQDFSARLARENGWSRVYAQRVCSEYLRFLFLAMKAGHPVTPSEEVDQAWHLHLVYTRSYWEELCGKVLGRPLHHEPTAGGLDEGAKFRDQYDRTLQSYGRWFGHAPPEDIWPPVEKRFGPHDGRWVDMTRHWLLPKPRFVARLRPMRAAAMLGVVLMTILVASCTESMNVFDWRGKAFLGFYWTAFIAAFVTSLLLVKMARGRARPSDEMLTDPYEIAYLGGGGVRVVDAALASLHGRGLVKVSNEKKGESGLQRLEDPSQPITSDVEFAVYCAMPGSGEANVKDVRKVLRPSMEQLRDRLVEKGLVVSNGQYAGLVLLAALPFVALGVTGVIKLFVGLGRGAPVDFLIMSLAVTLMVTIVRLTTVRRRTADGEAMWQRFKPLERAMKEKLKHPYEPQPDPLAVPLAVALVGVPGMNWPGYYELHTALQRNNNTSSGGCGSGCGSSGCGGGGCGGGGCGGCGGGD
ncbi:TIGR04222 domain-containing membrane protein [Roseimicrobium sp. ORNL1]|uniref:TIGR04222 domain-containing membrane protein n=1 Tax=Roseimicrobium sp. ORNL1 TaxID=2711231 RepID=UPI0013E17F03|nr:TIGR04222 domain-containing membrane protein [Roseimicrobium sp. ORNL1]QIF01313.1 TIGR04222 domain-containing membrane protein [Roseimicrobium sp. ORNL1]